MSTVILTQKRIVTRKDHLCSWCGESIKKGSSVHFVSGLFDGEFFSSRMHDECDTACSRSYGVSEDGYMPYENQRGKSWEEE